MNTNKMKKNFNRYIIHWCEFNIANPRATIPVYLLLHKVWMCNNITLYRENNYRAINRKTTGNPHVTCDHGRAVYLYIITCELQSLTHTRILDNGIYGDSKLQRCKFLSYRMTDHRLKILGKLHTENSV